MRILGRTRIVESIFDLVGADAKLTMLPFFYGRAHCRIFVAGSGMATLQDGSVRSRCLGQERIAANSKPFCV